MRVNRDTNARPESSDKGFISGIASKLHRQTSGTENSRPRPRLQGIQSHRVNRDCILTLNDHSERYNPLLTPRGGVDAATMQPTGVMTAAVITNAEVMSVLSTRSSSAAHKVPDIMITNSELRVNPEPIASTVPATTPSPLSAPPVLQFRRKSSDIIFTRNDEQGKPRGPQWRWYLQQGAENNCSGSLNADFHPPVSITLDKEWTAILEMENINSGSYSVVICISFENEEKAGEFSSAEFDVCQLGASGHPVDTKKTCKTVAEREELRMIKCGEENRIRLHRQIELLRGNSIRVTATLQTQGIQAVKVHYIELQQDDRNADDLVLYGEGKPDEVILFGVSPDAVTREHLTVHAHNISAKGTHAVTLCFDSENQAVIDVWSLLPRTALASSTSANNADGNGPNPLQQPPLQHTLPLARGFIGASDVSASDVSASDVSASDVSALDVGHADRADICLSISPGGRHVAIHSHERSQNGIPCHIFTINNNKNKRASVHIDMFDHHPKSNHSMLIPMSLPQDLQDFYGYGSFHLMNMASTEDRSQDDHHSQRVSRNEEIDWYITSDGTSVSVYKITSKCVLVRKMTFGSEPHLGAALDAISSLRGHYFAWTGDDNVLSIWDLVSGQQVSYFQVEGGSVDTRAHLSRDGSLVAVSVKGAITVHETVTGVKLGSYPHGLGDNNDFEIVLERYHAMVLDQLPTKDANEKMVERKIVSVSDMSIVRKYRIHRDYAVRSPVPATEQIFSYSQGSAVNIIRMDTELISAPVLYRLEDGIMTRAKIDQLSRAPHSYTSAAQNMFKVNPSTSVIYGTKMTLITIAYAGKSNQAYNGPEAALTIPLGSSHILYPAIFMKSTSRLAIVTGRYLQVWKLHDPSTADPKSGRRKGEIAELELLWALQQEEKEKHQEGDGKYQEDKENYREDKEKCQNKEKYQVTDICQREIFDALADMKLGEQFLINLRPAFWYRRSGETLMDPAHERVEVVTVPMSSKDTLSITLQERIRQGIRGVVDIYINNRDGVCRMAMLRYLRTLVRPSDDNPVSCIVTLCQFWKREERESFEGIMTNLLPTNNITWVPASSPQEREKDPLTILIKAAGTQPAALGVAKVIINYCIRHAYSSKNLAFLAPIFKSMHGMMSLFPEEAFECLSRMSYIPAKDRSHILDNHLIARPPRWRLQFWKPEERVLLFNKRKPIMQLHVTSTGPDASNDRFTLPVFMASFDALWIYHDDEHDAKDKDPVKENWLCRRMTFRNEVKTAVATTPMRRKMTRWTMFKYMLRLKLQLRNKTYVKCHDFKYFEFFDNPAIAALVAYKWNTMGFRYWLVRFIFQCFYYTLIFAAAILQVYLSDAKVLFGIFVAIIVMATAFTWLEIQQAFQGWIKYRRSAYNFLDLAAFLVPMAASVDQIVVILQNDQQGNARLLSFSVLIVSLHMLFELRINQGICKYVMIIQQAVTEMKVFFFIFAAGIFAFTVGMLHLVHACPAGGCRHVDDDGAGIENPGFPIQFFHALSSTYFFMGGLYDPISDKFNSDDWAFHIIMAIYFFFTVILMLNVLIALINVAFTKGDDGWRLTWVESRLRYIESAENMSYHIPGYRESHNCFPKEIYFSATEREVKAYRQRYRKKYYLKPEEETTSLAGANSTAPAAIEEAKDTSTLDAGGAEGGRTTETGGEKSKGDQSNESSNGRRNKKNKNDDNENNKEKDKMMLELESKIQSLQEQSERQFAELKEQNKRQLEELKELLRRQ